ncbi:MAG: LLM class flavin-dependent oxidoreductase [Acidimicrobiales bacterium]
MEFGMCVTTKLTDVGLAKTCEDLGYDMVWVPDTQMIWGDCYAYMALAAEQTSRVKLGTGVAVAGTRIAPVVAHSIASINTIAPGRTVLGIGSGNSAYRLMNLKPLPIAKFREELRVIRALLAGEEVEYTFRGKTAPMQLMMAERGYVNLEDPIPIVVSGFGPKAQALAGELGDGLFFSMPVEERSVVRSIETARRGASGAGRPFDEKAFQVVNLLNVIMLEPGESAVSERVLAQHGPYIASSMHYLFDMVRQYDREPPRHLLDVWEEYSALVARTPEHIRHLRIHAGHATFLLDEERKFITESLVREVAIVGSPEECIEQIRVLESAGCDQLVVLPAPDTAEQYAREFAEKIIQKY